MAVIHTVVSSWFP
jgi:hypothetical protein